MRSYLSNLLFRLFTVTVTVLIIVSETLVFAQVPPALHTAAPTFAVSDRYVATTVFHWYTPTGGQLSGPWQPLEGRANWTGESEWWRAQIKQMMSANIDVLYVHLIPTLESQRINLFKALVQLRTEGYDVPKVAPFLDPLIIWDGKPPVDLATTAGKDEFVGHYIRFYDQYFSVTTDAHAADYLARQDGKPILDTWHVQFSVSNLDSLTRADVATRLSAAFGGTYPCFNNGFVMVTTGLNPPTLSFADEQIPQFEVNEYYYPLTFNSIRSVQMKGGYWDENVRNPGSFLARDGGKPYADAWSQVDRATTHRVYVESWNEYDEGTGIYAGSDLPPLVAPSNTGGNADVWSSTGDPFEYIKTTAAGAAQFNDTPEHGATILWHNIPATLAPGETRQASVIVRNTGDASWTAAATYQLAQREADTAFVSEKRVTLDDSEDEIPLYGGIFRGRAKVFQLEMHAPTDLGEYTTHWQMMQGGGDAFGDELVVPIEVKSKADGTISIRNVSQVDDGMAKPVSAVTSPQGLSVNVTYDGSPYPPSAVGTYEVVASIDDANHQGRATATLVIKPDPNLLGTTGGFEFQALGSTVTSPPDVINDGAISGWRVFNVDSANADFQVAVVSQASVGSQALRLTVTNTGATSNYALDQWNPSMHTKVALGTSYLVSFDAAWLSGDQTDNLLFQVQEFDSSGNFVGNGHTVRQSVSSTDYQTFTMVYTPTHANAAQVGIYFSPMVGLIGSTSINLDRVQMVVAPPLLNGDFKLSPLATSGGGLTSFVDTTTFLGWRLFSVGSPPITSFVAETVEGGDISGGQKGSHALRLSVNNTDTPSGHDYGLDNDHARVPVVADSKHTLSFDVALESLVGGPFTFQATVAEFDAVGSFTGTQSSFTPTLPVDQTFHRHSFDYTVTNPATTQVVIAFRPITKGQSTLVLGNVSFAPFENPSPAISSPGLEIQLASPNLLLSWKSDGWELETTDSLTEPFVKSPLEATKDGDRWEVLAPRRDSRSFFRLSQPTPSE